jgi:hypothetical protein
MAETPRRRAKRPAGLEDRALFTSRFGALEVCSRERPACLWSLPSGYIGPRLLRSELACANDFAEAHPEGWWFVVDTRKVRMINPTNPILLRRLLRLPHLMGYVSISPRWIRVLAWFGRIIFRPTHLVTTEDEAMSILAATVGGEG